MIATFTILLLTVHLAAVSVASIAPFFCVWLEWRETRRGDLPAGEIGRLLARRSVELLVLGVTLGFLQLGMLHRTGDRTYFKALAAIDPSRWWFGGLELGFTLVLMIVYLVTWKQGPGGWRWWRPAIAITAATNLTYHFPTLFVITGVISERPALWGEDVQVRQMLLDPDVIARVLHFLLAALAITGAYVSWVVVARDRQSSCVRPDRRLAIVAGRWALAAAILQLPLGALVLMQLPGTARDQLLGADMMATCYLGSAILLSMYLLHCLAEVALGDADMRNVRRAGLLTLLIFLLMIGARQRMRVTTIDDRQAATAQPLVHVNVTARERHPLPTSAR